jgi:ABC-type antimicrobial peptide transport system permease subunit
METMLAHEGRFPVYDNEVAFPKLLAERLGKTIGDRVKVKANGLTQEYILCGYFSSASNNGQLGALTLEGYQRLDPNYRRTSIQVNLNEGVTFDEFEALLKDNYGVVNVYKQEENDRYSAAKARAEEKIANYLQYYGIDSVEYAVIYNGEIILSGSSGVYQIEKISNYREWVKSLIGVYGDIVSLLTQVISIISLVIVALILSMTVRQIVQKRRRELGIMKSGGYTTKQLARQLAISFLPFSLFGIVIGCMGGAFAVNPAMTAMFSSTGVHNANVFIYPPAAIIVGLLTLVFTFAVTNIAAKRIKRITVYELLSE